MGKVHCFDCSNWIPPKKMFMVNNQLWEKYGATNKHLCIGCFEKRLKRKLTKSDLSKCYVNEKINLTTIQILKDKSL
jgi:hypothetical protein